MSSLDLHLAAEIRSARATLRASAPGSATDPLAVALARAEDCLADLERAANLLRIAAQQQRLADEVADEAEQQAAAARRALAAGIAENAARHARHTRRAKRKKGGQL